MNSEVHAVRVDSKSDKERIRIEEKMDPNRYACTVLDEARAALKKLNWVTLALSKRHLATLLEEMQTIVNRMEAGLEDKSDYSYSRDRLRETRVELEVLRKEKKNLAEKKKVLKLQTKVLKGKVQSLEARVKELKEVIESKVPNYLEIYLNRTNGVLDEESMPIVEVSQ